MLSLHECIFVQNTKEISAFKSLLEQLTHRSVFKMTSWLTKAMRCWYLVKAEVENQCTHAKSRKRKGLNLSLIDASQSECSKEQKLDNISLLELPFCHCSW
jgi:hypothetical protein